MKIVLLCGNGITSDIVYNSLSKVYTIDAVIEENGTPTIQFVKKRIKKYGLFKVFGQICFSIFIRPFLKLGAKKRRVEILNKYSLDVSTAYKEKSNFKHVDSVNSEDCRKILQEINPDIVVVNGTRIISNETLTCVDSTFINMHAGITPKYRGSHGAYWAYYNKDNENAGVTVHLVDNGIDTGGILYQARIAKTKKDNFTTYPLLQIAEGIKLEIQAIQDILNDNIKIQKIDLPSGLYSHPTFFQYLVRRLRFGVK